MNAKFLLVTCSFLFAMKAFSQQRYIDQVFDSVNVTPNVVYGENYSFISGQLQSLVLDVYEPVGDTLQQRPLIIYMHPGDFWPVLVNGNATGDMHDSAVVEICKRFARCGFVVVSMDYRFGWVPLGGTDDIRKGTLIQAVYRGLQDAKTCVRYFRMNVSTQGNTYKVDTDKIVIGGQGSAGYIATAYASLDKPSELQLLKFIAAADDATYGFVQGQPYINQSIMGDFDGLGGISTVNNPNWPGYSSKVNMVFMLEGGIGDSSWIEAGDVPMVSFHDVNNSLTPYAHGVVIVPLTGQIVVDVSGGHDIIRIADQLGNNDVFNQAWTDPYSARADMVNDELEGLFPIVQPGTGYPFPFDGQINPWEWWSCSDLEAVAPAYGKTAGYADTVCQFATWTNPDMSKTKAMSYIDTVQGYLLRRVVQALQLPGFISGIHEVNLFRDDVRMFPDPAVDYFTLQLADASQQMKQLQLFDATGRLVKEISSINSNQVQVNRNDLPGGLYLLKIQLADRELNGKLILQ